MGPSCFLMEDKTEVISDEELMSAVNVRIFRAGKLEERLLAVEVREEVVRPIRAMDVEPDSAKEDAILGPRPDPPPVMTITFPAVERKGSVGEMAG